MSIIETCKKKQMQVFESIYSIFAGKRAIYLPVSSGAFLELLAVRLSSYHWTVNSNEFFSFILDDIKSHRLESDKEFLLKKDKKLQKKYCKEKGLWKS